MSSEKMAILKMLEEGKITAESAAKLLATINDDSREFSKAGEDGKSRESGREFGSQKKSSGKRSDSGWASDFGKKIEVVAKDLEPKIQKLAGVVIEKSVEIADAATKSIQSARERTAERAERASERDDREEGGRVYRETRGGAETYGTYQSASKPSGGKSFELSVSPDLPNEIILKSMKGDISIKGYNGDKATINAVISARRAGTELDFLKLGCVYQLNYDLEAFDSISLDVYLPFKMFKRLTIETEAGDVSLDNLEADNVTVNTSKCHVSVKNVKAGKLKIDNIDGEIILSGLSGEELLVENANGSIDAANTDFRRLKLETTAEPVSLISQGFYKHSGYEWTVRTSNARLKASLPVSSDLGYDIRAYTSLSDVSNGLSGISYSRNDRNCIEGKTENFETKRIKARIELDTSNAPLYIN